MNRPMIRSFRRYQLLARRTQNPALTNQERLSHAALGLCSEIDEFRSEAVDYQKGLADTAAVRHEAGDVLWMMAELCDALELDMSVVLCQSNLEKARRVYDDLAGDYYGGPAPVTKWRSLYEMGHLAAAMAGMVQKTFQGHTVEPCHAKTILAALFVRLQKTCRQCGLTPYQAMYQNIEKLKDRYPEGFSAENSIHRKEYTHAE